MIFQSDSKKASSKSKKSSKETKTVTRTQQTSTSDSATSPPTEGGRPSRLILRTSNDQRSILRFDSAQNENLAYQLAMNPQSGKFQIEAGSKTVLSINQDGTEIDCRNSVVLKTFGLEIQDLWKFEDSHMKYNGVPQWKLVHDEVFKVGENAEGWSIPDAVTKCGAINMLGGYCKTSSENLIKVFDNLPAHKRIRIQANFHFIDSWGGDTAFLKVSDGEDMGTMQYAWTESYDYVSSRNAVNVCGRDIGDGKFNTLIDFELLHNHPKVKLMFGSSLEQQACAASYGISMVRIYII